MHHMITLAKEGTLHARRQANEFIYEDLMTQKLFYELAERYGRLFLFFCAWRTCCVCGFFIGCGR